MAEETIQVRVIQRTAPNGTEVAVGKVPSEDVLRIFITTLPKTDEKGALPFAVEETLPDGRSETEFHLVRETAVLLRDLLDAVLNQFP
jgi:hypothetical protein